MSGLYLTEVNVNKKTDNFQSPDDELDINNGKSAFLIKNTKQFEETTSNMLNYMVEDQTDFADLMKIEEFLKTQTIEYCEEFNLNRHDIKNKSDYYHKISLEIEEVLNLK